MEINGSEFQTEIYDYLLFLVCRDCGVITWAYYNSNDAKKLARFECDICFGEKTRVNE